MILPRYSTDYDMIHTYDTVSNDVGGRKGLHGLLLTVDSQWIIVDYLPSSLGMIVRFGLIKISSMIQSL